MDFLFRGIFDSSTQEVIAVSDFLICVGISVFIGIFLAFLYAYKSECTQSFLMTLCILPAVVCVVIMMVNGNVGTGVAVAGAFSLIRFRSAQGTAKEISAIFTAMGSGIIAGMGYLGYAVLFALIIGLLLFFGNLLGNRGLRKSNPGKILQITIPENLDYAEVFDEILKTYTARYELTQVKTTNMGSLFKLTYYVELKPDLSEKEFLDKLRVRNGNLEISLGRRETDREPAL